MMFWKANLEVNWLMWKWTRAGFLYPTSGCKTPEIVLLNDLHSLCVCNFYFILYVSKYEIHEIQGSSGPQHLFNFELYLFFVRFLRCQVLKLLSLSFPLILVANTIIISKLEEASTNISICLKWTLNRVFEPNTKRNAEIIWIIQIHRQHWKTINTKNSNNDF